MYTDTKYRFMEPKNESLCLYRTDAFAKGMNLFLPNSSYE